MMKYDMIWYDSANMLRHVLKMLEYSDMIVYNSKTCQDLSWNVGNTLMWFDMILKHVETC